MNALLLATVLGIDPSFYHVSPGKAPTVNHYYLPPEKKETPKHEELPPPPEPEAPAAPVFTLAEPRAVAVYYDTRGSLPPIIDSLTRWGFIVFPRDSRDLGKNEPTLALPVLKYHNGNKGWKSVTGTTIESFIGYWIADNSSQPKPTANIAKADAGKGPHSAPQGSLHHNNRPTGYRGAGGPRWHIQGNDTREALLQHLPSEHRISYDLSLLSTEDLREIHSDAHNGRTGTFIWSDSAPRPAPAASRTTVAAVMPMPARIINRGRCPNGRCP